MAKWTMYFLEHEGALLRGFGDCYPVIRWCSELGAWVEAALQVPLRQPLPLRLTEAEAERCYPGSSTASAPAGVAFEKDMTFGEMIKYRPETFENDLPPLIRRSPEEEVQRAAVAAASTPDYVKERIAIRQKQLAAARAGDALSLATPEAGELR